MARRPLLPVLAASIFVALHVGSASSQEPNRDEQIEFFERRIRPVLVAECYSCHSAQAEEIEGGLTFDTREGIRKGGDLVRAVRPASRAG